MYQDKIVLCGANSYEEKFYMNPDFDNLPQHIKDELKQQIISGKFENGDKFYTEAELIKIYDVSSITVVRALNDLAADGYIVRQQGKGTFVSRARKHKLVEFSDVETFPIQRPKSKFSLLNAEIP